MTMTTTRTAERGQNHRRARGQNAILDRGLSGILATVAIIGVLGSYFLFSGSSTVDLQKNQITAITGQVGNLYGGTAQFTGLTTAVVANSGGLPPAWVISPGTAGAGLMSMYKSSITVFPITNPITGLLDGAYTLSVAGLPKSACIQLATNNIGPNQLGVIIPGGSAPTAGSSLPTLAAAAAACTGDINSLTFYFS